MPDAPPRGKLSEMTRYLIAVAMVCVTVALANCESRTQAGDRSVAPRLASKSKSIVFVCPHGSAKSVVAARFFNRMTGEQSGYHAVARGIEPGPTIPAAVREPLRNDGFEVGVDEKPTPIDLDEIRSAAAVVCIGCQLPQPYAAVARQALDWPDVPDVGDGYDAARDRIVAHLRELDTQLSLRPR